MGSVENTTQKERKMKMQKWTWLLAVLMVFGGMTRAAHAANIGVKSAVTSRGYSGGLPTGVTKVFKPSDRKIYGVIIFDRIFVGNARGVWTAISAKGIPANSKFLDNSTGKVRMDRAHFSAALPKNWPVGRYKLDIYLDGKLMRTLPFSIQ